MLEVVCGRGTTLRAYHLLRGEAADWLGGGQQDQTRMSHRQKNAPEQFSPRGQKSLGSAGELWWWDGALQGPVRM